MTPETAAALLQIPIDSTTTEIEKAFRRRARLTHPDRFHGASERDIESANIAFMQISDARDVLLARARSRSSTTPPKSSTPPHTASTPSGSSQAQGSYYESASRRAPKMSYDEFVRKFEASQWGPVPSQKAKPTESPQSQSSNRPQDYTSPTRASTEYDEEIAKANKGIGVAVGVFMSFLFLSVIITVMSTLASAETEGTTRNVASGDVSHRVTWNFDQQATNNCTSSSGCWVFRTLSPVTCWAGITVGFYPTATSVTPAEQNTFYRNLIAGSSIVLNIDGANSNYDYAQPLKTVCR